MQIMTKTDIGRSHRLIRATLRTNKRLARLKKKQNLSMSIHIKTKDMKESIESHL